MKAKKMIKKITTIVTSLAVLLCAAIPASAATPQETETVASYDRTIGGTQTFHLTDKNGEECIITVTEVPSTSRVANGTYKIKSEKKLFWTAGYKISVSGNQITSAYDKYYTTTLGSITNDVLRVDNSKQASYRFRYSIYDAYDTGVHCSLEGNTIKISVL